MPSLASKSKDEPRPTTENATLWLINAALVAMIVIWCAYSASQLAVLD